MTKKTSIIIILLTLLLLSTTLIQAETTQENIEHVAGVIGEGITEGLTGIEKTLLRTQTFLMGALIWISGGILGNGGRIEGTTFLFGLLIFLVIHEILEFALKGKKGKIILTFIITSLAVLWMPEQMIEAAYTQQQGLGTFISLILPLGIIIAFSHRNYKRAYEGKTKMSPFTAITINFILLLSAGIFYITYGLAEQTFIGTMRMMAGGTLIIYAFTNAILVKILSKIGGAGIGTIKETGERKKKRKELLDKIKEKELEVLTAEPKTREETILDEFKGRMEEIEGKRDKIRKQLGITTKKEQAEKEKARWKNIPKAGPIKEISIKSPERKGKNHPIWDGFDKRIEEKREEERTTERVKEARSIQQGIENYELGSPKRKRRMRRQKKEEKGEYRKKKKKR